MKIEGHVDGAAAFGQALVDVAQRDVKFANMVAVNRLAFGVRDAWAKRAATAFDRPVALTVKAAQYDKATPTNPDAVIKLREDAFKGTPPVKFLSPEVTGGPRRHKRFELALIRAGIMPSNLYAVPGGGAVLDGYGNVSAGTFTKILSYLRANPDEYAQTPQTIKRRRLKRVRGGQFFAVQVKRGRLVPGIYERFSGGAGAGSAVRLIIAFVHAPRYAPRYTVFDTAREYIDANYRAVMRQALDEAILSTLIRKRIRG